MRKIHTNVPVLFQPEDWTVTETEYRPEMHKNNETVFTVANGYLGVRGFFEEGICADPSLSDPTTMINGIYEYHPYRHIWQRPGFPGKYHSIIPQANALNVKVFADGEAFVCPAGAEDYRRVLDMKRGLMTRTFAFRTKSGKKITLRFERFASLSDVHLLFHRVTVTSDRPADIRVMSSLSLSESVEGTRKDEIGSASDEEFDVTALEREETATMAYRTAVSKFGIACSVAESGNAKKSSADGEGRLVTLFDGETSSPVVVERCAAYYTDEDGDDFLGRSKSAAVSGLALGFDTALKENERAWAEFWEHSDLKIEGDLLVQQGIRFSLFMLNQSTGRDGKTNISANGLTGTGYMGHTFWDTEIFILPMFLYSQPEIARQLLMYRYHILPNAEKRAKEMDDVGALYSWNSINGEECGHVFEASTAAYHLNSDICYAIREYYEATDDFDFMRDYGIEIIAKTAKCLSHRGNFIPLRDNKFCINCVCGPDEYNPVVDNNLYTNWMARNHFYFALEMLEKLRAEDPERYAELLGKCEADGEELDRWKQAADRMYLPYHEGLDLYMQDDNFLYKDPIDIEKIPLEKLPLLTNLHPLNLWRYQVIKQADIVLLTFLCSQDFTPEMKRKIFDFYEPKTIHDSSLSAGIHCIVAQDIGYAEEAYGYLRQAARMDLDNVNRNTFLGVHAACQGSAYLMIVSGFAGMRVHRGKLRFKPAIPENWKSYSFKIRFRGNEIGVRVSAGAAEFRLLEGEGIEFECLGERVTLKKSAPSVTVRL